MKLKNEYTITPGIHVNFNIHVHRYYYICSESDALSGHTAPTVIGQ